MTENTVHLALHYTHTPARTHAHTPARTRTHTQRIKCSTADLVYDTHFLRGEPRPCFIRHCSPSCSAFPVASLTSIRSVETELRSQLPGLQVCSLVLWECSNVFL